jgi:hypothetical protein
LEFTGVYMAAVHRNHGESAVTNIDRTDGLGHGVESSAAQQAMQPMPPPLRRRQKRIRTRRTVLMIVVAALSTLGALLALTNLTSPSPAAAEEGVFDAGMVPDTGADPDTEPVELGMRFGVTQPGTVIGVRFYGKPSAARMNTGSLWSSSGERLATSTFPTTDGLGWQSVTFDEPVRVEPGQTYVASYLAPAGYIGEQHGFDSQVVRGSVVAPAGAGVYRYGSRGGFPTQNWRNSNYFVDVRFVPGGGTATPSPSNPRPTPSTAPTLSPAPTAGTPTPTPTPQPTATTGSPGPTSAPNLPAATSFPNASNTGAKGNLTNRAGGTITSNGTVIANARINGQLTIRGDNVVLRNVHLTSASHYGILIYGKGTVIEDSTIVGTAPNTLAAIAAYEGGTVSARRIDVSGSEDGVRLANNSLLQDSYVHGLAGDSGSHYDAVTADGHRGWRIVHNTIINDHGQTAAVWIGDPRHAPSEGVLQDNWLQGGGYTIYAGPGTGAGLRVTGNVFSTKGYARSGYWGPVTGWVSAGNTWTGNLWADGPNAGKAVGP